MVKKILLGLAAVAVVTGGVAAMSAFEAHIINVTAHIENALTVDPEAIDFGTVFPQEYVENGFTVKLSKSFEAEPRVYDVEYVIKQKPKPYWPIPAACVLPDLPADKVPTIDDARLYCHQHPEDLTCCYRSLCPFLSKLPDGVPDNDTGVPSYYDDTVDPPVCRTVSPAIDGIGLLLRGKDPVDTWTVDLKVPPVSGYVGQDWPESCLDFVVPENDLDYGCDLYLEVTNISEVE